MTVLDRPTPAQVAPLHMVAVVLATVLASMLFAVGWTAAKVALAATWCATAIQLGWDDARRAGPH